MKHLIKLIGDGGPVDFLREGSGTWPTFRAATQNLIKPKSAAEQSNETAKQKTAKQTTHKSQHIDVWNSNTYSTQVTISFRVIGPVA